MSTILDTLNTLLAVSKTGHPPNNTVQNYPQGSRKIQTKLLTDERFIAAESLQPPMNLMAWCQICTGCRYSELMLLRACDVLPRDLVHITGTKGSADRFLCIPGLNTFLASSDLSDEDKLFKVSYTVYRRALISLGIYTPPAQGHKNRVISHLFRHDFALDSVGIHGLGKSFDSRYVLGHKSQSTLTYYTGGRNGTHTSRNLR